MKLNYEGRWELRKKIEELLETVPEGNRIRLDKQLLETLLFEEELFSIGNFEGGIKEKIGKAPIWSGAFLRKLDLSQVSFDNVKWSLAGVSVGDDIIEKYNFMTGDVFGTDDEVQNENIMINYSYTNAVIDFSKSFDFINKAYRGNKPVISITNCSLAGVDLSNNNCDEYGFSLWNCNLSNSGIKICNIYSIDKCNFENVNLTDVSFNLEELLDEYGEYDISFSLFCDSGLNINGNINDLNINQKFVLFDAIREGRLNGCYFNGKLITGILDDLLNTGYDEENEYEKMKANLFASVTQSIEEQKKSFKR